MLKVTQDRVVPTKIQYTASYAKIKRGIQQEMAPFCTETNYQPRCHQACNVLTAVQTCHARSCCHNILWKCPEHGSGNANFVVPIFEWRSKLSAAGKLCSVCSTPIRPRYADLAYHCTDSSCPNACHLIPTCSGFPIPRGEARHRELATRIWKCHLHLHGCQNSSRSTLSTTASTTITTSTATCSLTFTFPKILTKPRSILKEKCGKCSVTLQSNTVPVRCNRCNKSYHQKCSTGPKAPSRDINWTCDKCAKILQQSISADITQPPAPTNNTPSHHLPNQSWDKLTTIQWNADGIQPKMLELGDKLINSDIDIVAIQESKLRKKDKTPSMEGYATILYNRNNILGGGLLFFICNDVIFKMLQSLEKAGMEILSIRVCTSKSLWIEINNVYITNTTTQ